MVRGDLVSQIVGMTDLPYREEHITLNGGKDKQQFFYDMNAKMDEGGKGKKRKRDGEAAPPRSSGPCWFCLSSAELEKHLILSVGTHCCYLALPKGGLTDDHVLILPIGHHANLIDLPEEVEQEVSQFKSALRKMYNKAGKAPVFFERNYKTQHLQIQVYINLSISIKIYLNNLPRWCQ